MKRAWLICSVLLFVAQPVRSEWLPTVSSGITSMQLTESLGPELVTQTCAGWGLTAPVGSWSCSGTTITRNPASGSNLSITNAAVVAGTLYKVAWTPTNGESSTMGVRIGLGGKYSPWRQKFGAIAYTEYLKATTTGAVTITVKSTTGTLTVPTTVSVKAVLNSIESDSGPLIIADSDVVIGGEENNGKITFDQRYLRDGLKHDDGESGVVGSSWMRLTNADESRSLDFSFYTYGPMIAYSGSTLFEFYGPHPTTSVPMPHWTLYYPTPAQHEVQFRFPDDTDCLTVNTPNAADGAIAITTQNENTSFKVDAKGTGTVYTDTGNPAGGSKTSWKINPTLGIMDGADTYKGLSIDLTNADHTGSGNSVVGLDIDTITGDANATESAVSIGTGWDYAINLASFDGDADFYKAGSSISMEFRSSATTVPAYKFHHNGDTTAASVYDFTQAFAATELTATNIVQDFLAIKPEFLQTSTAGYNVIHVVAAEPTTAGGGGSGAQNLLLLETAGEDFSSPVTKYRVSRAGMVQNAVQAVTCADDAAGTNAALTITPASSYIEVTSADAQGCDVTIAETGAAAGNLTTICIVSVTAGAVNFVDMAGVTELAGAFASNVDDCITLRYGNTTTWREVSRSAN